MGYNGHIKQMKKTVLFVFAILFATVSFSQTTTAVLVHNDSVQVFYGTNALVNAHAAAVAGDVITLSSGTFTGLTITKPITLRGAGMKADTGGIVQPTIIATDITLSISNNTQYHFTMEGIRNNSFLKYQNVTNPQFIKCMLNYVTYNTYSNGSMSNAVFVNCIIGTFYDYNNIATNNSFYNSFIGNLYCPQSTLYNSVCGYSTGSEASSLSAYNSILYDNGETAAYPVQGYFFSNCVGIQSGRVSGWNSDVVPYFSGTWSSNNTSLTNYSSVFQTFVPPSDTWDNNSWYQNVDLHLTDSAAATYLGSDSTQVGIYGGTFPFNPVPNYITVRRLNVASRSTADGRLSVDIELISE